MIECLPINKDEDEGEVFEILRKDNFSGGEINLQVPVDIIRYDYSHIFMKVSLKTADDFFELAMAVDAIRRCCLEIKLSLLIGYFPYGRQDRVCNEGEALGVKVFAEMINQMGFVKVVVADPHSDVIVASLDNGSELPQHNILGSSFKGHHPFFRQDDVEFVSPDAGANKKTLKAAKMFDKESFIRADKIRDTSTGAISDIVVYADDLTDKICIIVDDICDRGGTFIGLAEELRKKGAVAVHLYVTHSILPDGVKYLLDNGINILFTTNGFNSFDVPPEYEGRVFQENLFW